MSDEFLTTPLPANWSDSPWKGMKMAKKIGRFEDFIAWQKARKLTSEIYKVTNRGLFSRDFGLKDQIRRAAVSSMSNLAEGFERGRPGEFHQFSVGCEGLLR
jgi:hypothetical protein